MGKKKKKERRQRCDRGEDDYLKDIKIPSYWRRVLIMALSLVNVNLWSFVEGTDSRASVDSIMYVSLGGPRPAELKALTSQK